MVFFASRTLDFGIVKFLIEFSFFQGIQVRIDTRIDTIIYLGPMVTKLGRQVHLEVDSNENYQSDAGGVITSKSRDKIKTLCLQYQSDLVLLDHVTQ